MLTTRELAIALWGVVFFAWALLKPDVRAAAFTVVKTALTPKIVVPVSLLAVYVGLCVYGLHRVGFWTPGLTKDTLIWFAFTGLVLPFGFVAGEEEDGFWAKFVEDNLRAFVVVQFIANLYTFHVLVELMIVPIVAVIAAVGAYAEHKTEHRPVVKLADKLQAVVGLIVVALAFHRAFSDLNLASTDNVRGFLLPLVLTLLLAPYVYVLLLAVRYEDLVVRIGLAGKANWRVRHYGALRIMWNARLRPGHAWDFFRANSLALLGVETGRDVDRILAGGGLTNAYDSPRAGHNGG